ncbi:MAG: nickel-dependent hydrogenase large subunit [Pirellulales bacterium]
MPTTIKVGPLTRIEGHLDIEAAVDTVGSAQKVVTAKSSGTMFRGFEIILNGRDPRDAPHYTQRICGVCPTSHGMAASMTLEAAYGIKPTDNGRIMRNLILGADFVQSHILHFYHLAALDYINTTGVLDISPWTPRYVTPDMIGGTTAATLVGHYVQALAIRRKAHQIGAIFGGKLPCSPKFVPGGCAELVTAQRISAFGTLLAEVLSFIRTVYLPDVQALASLFPNYATIGKGCGNLLAYGVFDLDANGTAKLLKRGRYTNGAYGTVTPENITEYVKYSRYTPASGNVNPSVGVTVPQEVKLGAYSWIKAPRYLQAVHEVGALARMWVNGDYRKGISVMDRHAARAQEAEKIAVAMGDWLKQLVPGGPTQTPFTPPQSASGIGWTEAPRGALGHWLQITNGLISRYQVLSPTGWNASPMDDFGLGGAIEQALVGTPVADPKQPIELLRVVHSFDPCLSCSVHAIRPAEERHLQVIEV